MSLAVTAPVRNRENMPLAVIASLRTETNMNVSFLLRCTAAAAQVAPWIDAFGLQSVHSCYVPIFVTPTVPLMWNHTFIQLFHIRIKTAYSRWVNQK